MYKSITISRIINRDEHSWLECHKRKPPSLVNNENKLKKKTQKLKIVDSEIEIRTRPENHSSPRSWFLKNQFELRTSLAYERTTSLYKSTWHQVAAGREHISCTFPVIWVNFLPSFSTLSREKSLVIPVSLNWWNLFVRLLNLHKIVCFCVIIPFLLFVSIRSGWCSSRVLTSVAETNEVSRPLILQSEWPKKDNLQKMKTTKERMPRGTA